MIKRLRRLFEQTCANCEHLHVLPDEPFSTRFDCFCPDFDWGDCNPYRRGDPEYYWDPVVKNDCKHFKFSYKNYELRDYMGYRD